MVVLGAMLALLRLSPLTLEILVQHRVNDDRLIEVLQLVVRRQLPVDQEVRDFEKRTVCREVLD